MSLEMRLFLQKLTESCGFPHDFRLKKLTDTAPYTACLQMRVGDQWLSGPTWTFA